MNSTEAMLDENEKRYFEASYHGVKVSCEIDITSKADVNNTINKINKYIIGCAFQAKHGSEQFKIENNNKHMAYTYLLKNIKYALARKENN